LDTPKPTAKPVTDIAEPRHVVYSVSPITPILSASLPAPLAPHIVSSHTSNTAFVSPHPQAWHPNILRLAGPFVLPALARHGESEARLRLASRTSVRCPIHVAKVNGPFMTARRAFEDQCVLTELIAKFLDMKSACHAANCCDTSQMRPSSMGAASTLYKEYVARQLAAPDSD
jgi:hypothetical protein